MSSARKRIVIIGASSAIAEHCARLWIGQAAADLILVGRDAARTERVAADLRVRSPQSHIQALQADFMAPASIDHLVQGIYAQGAVDIALIAHGSLPEQSACQTDLALCRDALLINGVSPALFAQAFAQHMQALNTGTLALLSSVAGERGRKSNYVYGAAKGLVTRLAQGLAHRLAHTGVKIVLIKPGPTDTPMTAHLKRQGARLAPVDQVARRIVLGIERGQRVIYAPARWGGIMMVIRHLPAIVFNRLDI